MRYAWLAMAVVLVAACDASGGYRVRVSFSPTDLASEVSSVDLVLVDRCPARGTLSSDPHARQVLARNDGMAMPLPAVPPGTYRLAAVGRGIECRTVAWGCSSAHELVAGGSGVLEVELAPASGEGCDPPARCIGGACRVQDGGTRDGGVCTGCDDGIPCTIDRCADGGCVHEPDDTRCVDGEEGTCDPAGGCSYERCGEDTCMPQPCTVARCESSRCVLDFICGNGEMCCAGACVPAACDDDNPCTTDVCGAEGCEHTELDAVPCDDGLFCNGGGTCVTGTCEPTGEVPCPGSACDEGLDECVRCVEAEDCQVEEVPWSPCDWDGPCDESARQQRTVDEWRCIDNECRSEGVRTESRVCRRDREDADCDDGVFCNGPGVCDSGRCNALGDPCPRRFCDESEDACFGCHDDGDCAPESCVAASCEPDGAGGTRCIRTFTPGASCSDSAWCAGDQCERASCRSTLDPEAECDLGDCYRCQTGRDCGPLNLSGLGYVLCEAHAVCDVTVSRRNDQDLSLTCGVGADCTFQDLGDDDIEATCVRCEGSDRCIVDCPEVGACNLDCAESSTCAALCDGDSCHASCAGTATCAIDCSTTTGPCNVACTGPEGSSGSCEVLCGQGTCEVLCGPTCNVDCGRAASCVVRCADGEAATPCPEDGRYSCDGSC